MNDTAVGEVRLRFNLSKSIHPISSTSEIHSGEVWLLKQTTNKQTNKNPTKLQLIH